MQGQGHSLRSCGCKKGAKKTVQRGLKIFFEKFFFSLLLILVMSFDVLAGKK